jgi:hypothetical protein
LIPIVNLPGLIEVLPQVWYHSGSDPMESSSDLNIPVPNVRQCSVCPNQLEVDQQI